MKKILSTILFLVGFSPLFSQKMSSDTIHWSSARPLIWADFKGHSIDTSASYGDVDVEILATAKKSSKYNSSNTFVVTVFSPKGSWIKSETKTDVALKYFQVMFDIGELYSRKLRKSIAEAEFDAYPVSFEDKYNASKIGLKDRIRQFKAQSKQGTFESAIDKWHDAVKSEMADLEVFKQIPTKPVKK